LLEGQSTVTPASSTPPIDLAQALDDLGGDKALLQDIVALFLEDAPVSIDQLGRLLPGVMPAKLER
jgi:hypothetical protein